jgi:hypothetical protein
MSQSRQEGGKQGAKIRAYFGRRIKYLAKRKKINKAEWAYCRNRVDKTYKTYIGYIRHIKHISGI